MTLIRRNNNLLPNIFDGLFHDDHFHSPSYKNFTHQKSITGVNIKETDHDFQIEVAIPGIKKEDINIVFENNKLTISSTVEDLDEESNEYTRREFFVKSFERSFTIDEKSINGTKIKADFENGVLLLSLPKREEVKPKPARAIKIS